MYSATKRSGYADCGIVATMFAEYAPQFMTALVAYSVSAPGSDSLM
jgi:hypothetical protein